MALFVNTNVSSINGRSKLNAATNALNTTYQRLSSGLRINSARDDSAGLAISDRMTAQINGLNQGNRNASDGVALAQTAEGAMNEMTNMLHRMRTLAVQSANGTNTKSDRSSLQKEVTSLSKELTRVADKTTFNGQKILAGKDEKDNNLLVNGKLNFQVGSNANDEMSVDLSDGFSLEDLITAEIYQENGTDLKDEYKFKIQHKTGDAVAGGADGIKLVEEAGARVLYIGENLRDKLFKSTDGGGTALFAANNSTDIENKTQLEELINSTIWDKTKDVSTEAAKKSTGSLSLEAVNQILGEALGFQIDGPKKTVNRGKPDGAATDNKITTETAGDISAIGISTAGASQTAITMIDKYIGNIDSARADLGAMQIRLESTIRNQQNIMENTSDARARIRDTDFAEETANLSQQTIIQQAAQSMLMQSNQRPQIALSLLR